MGEYRIHITGYEQSYFHVISIFKIEASLYVKAMKSSRLFKKMISVESLDSFRGKPEGETQNVIKP